MMKMITIFIESSKSAIAMGISIEAISTMPVMRRLMRMGEEIGEGDLAKFNDLHTEIDDAFAQLRHNAEQAAASNES